MESYGYRLTHDFSIDDFQSGDIYNDEECAVNQRHFEDYGTGPTDCDITRHSLKDQLNSGSITLELDENRQTDKMTMIITDQLEDDAAAKLSHILDGEEKTAKREVSKEKGRRKSPPKKRGRGRGRKLPPTPVQRPDTLDVTRDHVKISSKDESPSPLQKKSLTLVGTPSSSETCPNGNVPSPFNTLPSLPHQTRQIEGLGSTCSDYLPFLSNTNLLLQEDSSPEVFPGSPNKKRGKKLNKYQKEELCKEKEYPYYQPITLVIDGKVKVQTHKALFRFIPRHEEQVLLDVNDPIYVEEMGADGWCDGINLRTGEEGCFPERYATVYTRETETEPGQKSQRYHLNRFRLQFLGSVETPLHKGNEVLCRAISKVITARKITHTSHPPSECILEISDHGVKMIDLSKKAKNSPQQKRDSVRRRVEKFLSGRRHQDSDHYFSLKNVSFCGYHPANTRYFGFITKHPLERRYACHVYCAESDSETRQIAEVMGNAFRRFYAEFLDYTNPTQDFYME